MPELPEVETVRRSLAPAVGATITGVRYSGLPLRLKKKLNLRAHRSAATDAAIEGARRLGKYLLVDLVDGPASILIHLGMSGRLRIMRSVDDEPPHTHVVWSLADGRELRFSDPRRFGQVDLVPRGDERSHPALAKLGIDPLVDELDGPALHALTRRSRQVIKTFLLDQRQVAGVGNIYASEALWMARIRPTVRANTLSGPRAASLARAIPAVLERALTHGGTSLRDFIAADGRTGEFADYLQVYGRDGEACLRRGCRSRIKRVSTQGRATFFCPGCQLR